MHNLDNNNLKLTGVPNKPVFIFIHGFGTAPPDLYPLAYSFNELGYTCELIHLKGHTGLVEDLEKADYNEWLNQVSVSYKKYTKLNQEIFLVGFSIGSILAIDFATQNPVSGILAISTFFSYKYSRLASAFFNVAKIFSSLKFKRNLHTTISQTRNQITMTPYLPIKACYKVLKEGERVLRKIHKLCCPLLFLHSLDDRVASYNAISEAVKTCGATKCHVVTLRKLDHFLQFDISPVAIRALALNFFELKTNTEIAHTENILKETYVQCNEESRHWTNIIFRLVIGFFSVFGTLVYFTLKEIVGETSKAPYFLVSYSIALNIYLLLFLLYFFYMNRVDIYTKHHIEPMIRGFSWVSFRTLQWASTKTTKMTKFVSVPIVTIPFIVSSGVILYCLIFYSEYFLSLKFEYLLLKFSILTAVILWCCAISSAYTISRYIRLELRKTVRARSSNPEFQSLLYQLYDSIIPGQVRQPEQNGQNIDAKL